jgi:hypothetical protein
MHGEGPALNAKPARRGEPSGVWQFSTYPERAFA